jgi:hypothetical protein
MRALCFGGLPSVVPMFLLSQESIGGRRMGAGSLKVFYIYVDFINPACMISVFGVYPFISQEYASNKSNREIVCLKAYRQVKE